MFYINNPAFIVCNHIFGNTVIRGRGYDGVFMPIKPAEKLK